MKVELRHRHIGKHSFIKEYDLPGVYKDYLIERGNSDRNVVLDEEKIINNLPKNWLPVDPNKILLMTSDGRSGCAIVAPLVFRPWGKYFDCYSVEVIKDGYGFLKLVDEK